MSAKTSASLRSECGKFWFDEFAAQAAVEFFPRNLCLTDGEWTGQPFILEPWQRDDVISPFFGWKRADGTRRYRRIILWVPRKNGKTELLAGVGLIALVADGEISAKIYSLAATKEQAEIVFEKAAAMVELSPTLKKHVACYKPSIFCAELGSSFKPLSGQAKGKHGLNASGVLADELHEWRSGDLLTFVHQSSASRRQPIEMLISTAGTRSGYGWEVWQHCQRVISGEIEDPETLIVVYAATPDDDWRDPETWKKANPNYGVSVKPDYLAAECQKAQSSPRLENDFKRYHLNLWTENATRWLSMDLWGKVGTDWAEPWFEGELEGQVCYLGCDLSSTADLTAYCLWFPPVAGREKWRKITRAFVPALNIEARVKHDGVPYDQWLAKGAIFATPGNAIDYDFVKAAILKDAERFKIEACGFDPHNATQVMIQLANEGLPMLKVRQGFLTLSPASKELERLNLLQMIEHGGHPVARWCAANCAVVGDPAGNIKPTKEHSTERIDVIAADVTALACWMVEKEEVAVPMIMALD